MGAGVAAAHLVVFITVASVGTLLVGAATDSWRENTEAQAEAIDRLKATAHEDMDLAATGFEPATCINDNPPPGCQGTQIPGRTWANFTNNGGDAIPLDEVDVLVNGTYTLHADLAVYQVTGATTSNLWLPGETLEIRVDDRGDADVTVVGPYGTKAYRRA